MGHPQPPARTALNLLAIETSTETLSLAVSRGDALFETNLQAGQRHAEMVFDEIRKLLAQAGLALADIGGIVYGRGPGSFTGLRVACGVTQGLAFALGIRVQGVITLEAVAEAAHAESGADQVIACIDARMGEVYHAAYKRSGATWTEVLAPGLYDPAAVPDVPGAGWVGCGSGFAAHQALLEQRYAAVMRAVRPELAPTARAGIALARPRFEAGLGELPADALPLYIRDKVALKKSERI